MYFLDLIIVLLLFILFIRLVYCKKSNNEGFEENRRHLARMPLPENLTFFDDSLFANVKTYKNDDKIYCYENEPCGRLGIDKCIDDCKGRCVEFGITGMGYCFE